jgi:hypothetical protein
MLHSSSRHNVSRIVVALSLLVAVPAFAKKKAAEEAAPPAAEAAEAAPVDPKLVPPTPDTFGRVHFGPSSGADLGRVSVKAPSSDNVRIFLEGRFFGTAPITIYSVPKGDYIIEGTYPDGKTVSKAISVLENDEAAIDLTGAHAALEAPKAGAGMFGSKDISESRMLAMKVFAIGGAAALAVGITFGILEMMKENDYKNAPANNAQLDSIASTGKNYALIANIGFALTFVGAVGAAVCAYPLFVKPNAEKKTTVVSSSSPVFVVVPTASGAAGSVAMRF